MRAVVDFVLKRIQERSPEQYAAIRYLVRGIVPLSKGQQGDGTMGQWVNEEAIAEDPSTWGDDQNRVPGTLFLAENVLDDDQAIANVAHEFGHACTTLENVDARSVGNEEWAHELSADYYADKVWGFHDEIERSRISRQANHHGPKPGEPVIYCGKKYLITDDYGIEQI